MSKPDSRIYVGNLPQDIRTKEIEDIFYKYGKIKYIDLKNRKGPPYAFVEFEDALDAKDAVESRDGYNYEGHKLRVEFQKGARGGGGGGGSIRSGRSGPPTRRSENRCIITGLPPTGSWQDLKDHMREAGNVCYADVFKDGTGVVEFIRYEDMKYAIKHLDDTKFRSHEGESSYIRVKADTGRGRSRSRSPRSRSRSSSGSRRRRSRERGSPSYSPARRSRSYDEEDEDRSHRGSRSNGHAKRRRSRTRSRSRSHSRSRSPRRARSRSRSAASKSKSRSKSRSRTRSRSSKRDRRSHSKSPSVNGDAEAKKDAKETSAEPAAGKPDAEMDKEENGDAAAPASETTNGGAEHNGIADTNGQDE